MKKFEEEVKRPVIGIEQSSIKPSLGKAIEFYTGKVKEYHNAFNEMNKYIDGLEAQLDYYKKDKRFEVMAEKILSLKSQLEKQQPEIPEVPQFVADWYEENKSHLEYRIWKYIRYWDGQEKDDFYNFMNSNQSNPIETLINMKNGYTVEKEKRYEVVFLEDDTTRQILMENNAGYYFIEEESENYGYWKQDFTEMEIKEINEKFWQLSVPVKDEQIEVEE